MVQAASVCVGNNYNRHPYPKQLSFAAPAAPACQPQLQPGRRTIQRPISLLACRTGACATAAAMLHLLRAASDHVRRPPPRIKFVRNGTDLKLEAKSILREEVVPALCAADAECAHRNLALRATVNVYVRRKEQQLTDRKQAQAEALAKSR